MGGIVWSTSVLPFALFTELYRLTPAHQPYTPTRTPVTLADIPVYGYCHFLRPRRLHGRHYMLRRRSGFTLHRRPRCQVPHTERTPKPRTQGSRTRKSKHKHRTRPPLRRHPSHKSRRRPTTRGSAAETFGPDTTHRKSDAPEMDYQAFFERICDMSSPSFQHVTLKTTSLRSLSCLSRRCDRPPETWG